MSFYDQLRDNTVLEQSETITFIDLSNDVVNISEHPQHCGGFCDVHVGVLRGGTRVALKKLRLYKGFEKVKKVRDLSRGHATRLPVFMFRGSAGKEGYGSLCDISTSCRSWA